MVTTAATMLFLLIVAALVAFAAIAGVVLLLGSLAGLTTALAALVEWVQQHRPRRREHPRPGSLRHQVSRAAPLRWAAAKIAEVEGRDAPVEKDRRF
jgi:hypothetical protein